VAKLASKFDLAVTVGGVIGLGIFRGPGEIAEVIPDHFFYLDYMGAPRVDWPLLWLGFLSRTRDGIPGARATAFRQHVRRHSGSTFLPAAKSLSLHCLHFFGFAETAPPPLPALFCFAKSLPLHCLHFPAPACGSFYWSCNAGDTLVPREVETEPPDGRLTPMERADPVCALDPEEIARERE
jgi:hypothetical protein